jgi:invasion protein IalB
MKSVGKVFVVTLALCLVCAVTFVSLSESKKNDEPKKTDDPASAAQARTVSKKSDDTKKSAEQVKTGTANALKSGQKFGEWTYLCTEKEDGDNRCFLAQDRVIEGKGRALRLLLGRFSSKGEMVLKALTPLGIYLPSGVAYKIDENPQAPMVLQNCTAEGCEAAVLVDDKLLKDLQGGKKLVVGFTSGAAEKTIGVDAQLEGLVKGLEALNGK